MRGEEIRATNNTPGPEKKDYEGEMTIFKFIITD